MGIFRFFKRNLGAKLNFVFILALSVLLVALIVTTRVSLESFTLQTGRQRVEQETQTVKTRFAESERELLANAKALARTPGLAEAVANRDVQQIRILLLVNSALYDLDYTDVVDTEGERILTIVEEGETFDTGQEDALLTLALIGSEATGLIIEEEGQEPVARLAAVTTLRAMSGEIVGGLLVSRTVDEEFLGQINFNRQDIQLVLISKGRLLARAVSEHGHEEYNDLEGMLGVLLNQTTINQALDGQTVIAEDVVTSNGGSTYALTHMPLTVGGDTQAVLGVLVDLDNLFVFQRQLITIMSIIFLLLAVGAVVGVTLFVRRSVGVPINGLRSATELMASGNYNQRIEIASIDEIGQLGGAFNSMAAKLQTLVSSLEESSRRQRIIAGLGEHLSAILDFDQLLVELVNNIKQQFDYYHVHIYMVDNNRQNLVMTAGVGEAGAQMKAQGHSIPLNALTSLVARAARTGQIVRVDNVREAEDWLPNPLLPDTYSEMAVPIRLGVDGQIVGVLDVQENKIAGLDEGDVSLLRSLANQVAIALNNARRFAEVEDALTNARIVQEQYLEQAWHKTRIASQGGQHLYVRPGAPPLPETALTRAEQLARSQSHPVALAVNGDDPNPKSEIQNPKSIVAPVMIGNKTIGALQLHQTDSDHGTPPWTDEDLAIVEAVLDQVAQAAENIRLFGETQERAGYERLVGEITQKLRQAPTLETLTKIAGEELGKALGVSHSVVKVGGITLKDQG